MITPCTGPSSGLKLQERANRHVGPRRTSDPTQSAELHESCRTHFENKSRAERRPYARTALIGHAQASPIPGSEPNAAELGVLCTNSRRCVPGGLAPSYGGTDHDSAGTFPAGLPPKVDDHSLHRGPPPGGLVQYSVLLGHPLVLPARHQRGGDPSRLSLRRQSPTVFHQELHLLPFRVVLGVGSVVRTREHP